MDSVIGRTRRTTGVRTGGRSERVVAAVLHAAIAELARVGYVALRLEDVATRAGVAKTTIYRRWPTKLDVVRAAVYEFSRYDEPLPDTGSLRSDMLQLLEHTMDRIGTPEGLALARMLAVEGSAELAELMRDFKEKTREHRAQLVVRAKKRGELPASADANLMMDCVFTFVLSRLVRFGETIDRATCTRLIDLVVTGAEHGGGARGAR